MRWAARIGPSRQSWRPNLGAFNHVWLRVWILDVHGHSVHARIGLFRVVVHVLAHRLNPRFLKQASQSSGGISPFASPQSIVSTFSLRVNRPFRNFKITFIPAS